MLRVHQITLEHLLNKVFETMCGVNERRLCLGSNDLGAQTRGAASGRHHNSRGHHKEAHDGLMGLHLQLGKTCTTGLRNLHDRLMF